MTSEAMGMTSEVMGMTSEAMGTTSEAMGSISEVMGTTFGLSGIDDRLPGGRRPQPQQGRCLQPQRGKRKIPSLRLAQWLTAAYLPKLNRYLLKIYL